MYKSLRMLVAPFFNLNMTFRQSSTIKCAVKYKYFSKSHDEFTYISSTIPLV